MPIISWNRAKSLRNEAMGRPALRRFRDIDIASALVVPSPRFGEDRVKVIGMLDGRLHVAIVLTDRNRYHVISLRAASPRERGHYAARSTR